MNWNRNSDGYMVGIDMSVVPKRVVYQHVYIVEQVLGRSLPKGAEVHHFDENRSNNSNNNLVVCQDKAYHKLLHSRQNAMAACGNPNWRACAFCKKYDDIRNMKIHSTGRQKGTAQARYRHSSCFASYRRGRRGL